jgi:CRP/FNR family cyclic AMP-dependent transcriptional regulator
VSTPTTVAERIAAHPFLEGLPAELLAALAGYAEPVRFRAGDRIFDDGEIADRFWLIDSGRVAIDMAVAGRGDQIVETLVAPTVLGWSWIEPPYRWHFGALALAESTAVAVDATSVRQRADRDPAFGYALLRRFTPIIVGRLQATRLRVLDLYAPGPAGVAR